MSGMNDNHVIRAGSGIEDTVLYSTCTTHAKVQCFLKNDLGWYKCVLWTIGQSSKMEKRKMYNWYDREERKLENITLEIYKGLRMKRGSFLKKTYQSLTCACQAVECQNTWGRNW